MSNLGHDVLKEPIDVTYDLLGAQEQGERLHELNIGLVANGADIELNAALEQARLLGYKPFRWQNVVGAVAGAITKEGIEFPTGRRATKERGQVIDTLLDKFAFHADSDADVRIVFTSATGEESEVPQKKLLSDREVSDAVHAVSDDPATANLIFGKIIQRVGTYVRSQHGLVFGEARAGQVDSGGDPHFLVESG